MPDEIDYVISMAVSHSPDFPVRSRGERREPRAPDRPVQERRRRPPLQHHGRLRAERPPRTEGRRSSRGSPPGGSSRPTRCRRSRPSPSCGRLPVSTGFPPSSLASTWPTATASPGPPSTSSPSWRVTPIPVPSGDDVLYAPIHTDDIARQVPLLLDVAAVPAVTVNWAGPDVVSLREWCRYLGDLVGKTPVFEESERIGALRRYGPDLHERTDRPGKRSLAGGDASPGGDDLARASRVAGRFPLMITFDRSTLFGSLAIGRSPRHGRRDCPESVAALPSAWRTLGRDGHRDIDPGGRHGACC